MINFSVLISVYFKENSSFFEKALASIWDDQTLQPTEIVVVKDGELTPELDAVLIDFSKKAPVKVVALSNNVGLGKALAIGLDACSYELVARMDSDDVAVSTRFENQISYLIENPTISLLSSQIAEFDNIPRNTISIRNVPVDNDSIVRFSKSRNPMNHMAVVFKKSAVSSVGGYLPFLGYEDYYLWVRMLKAGFQAHNHPEVLMHARVGNNMLSRRQGYVFFNQELKLQVELKRLKHINSVQLFRNIILRALPRLFPIFGLKMVYNFLRKKND
jgi:glycosyltransferase involved in cell wall biosynthesis